MKGLSEGLKIRNQVKVKTSGDSIHSDYQNYVARKKANGESYLSEIDWTQKVNTLKANTAAYSDFKASALESFKGTATHVETNITIETRNAAGETQRVQVKAIGFDEVGNVRIQDYTTAANGLSVNRQALLEDLSKYGGRVVGEGKGAFTGGTVIKPGTQIDVVSKKTGSVTVKGDTSVHNSGNYNTLGQQIVTFNNQKLSPTAKAKSWQGAGLYPGIDEYVDIRFNKGDKIYILESDFEVTNKMQSGYATTLETIEKSGYDSKKLSESLQIKPHYDKKENPYIAEYRQQITEYKVTSDDLYGAFGEQTLANPHFGDGGAPQYFIKDFQEQIAAGKISRGESYPLTNFEISAEDYKEMINQVSN